MKRVSAENIVSFYQKNGYTFSNYTTELECKYSASDGAWNYRDFPHLYHVHDLLVSEGRGSLSWRMNRIPNGYSMIGDDHLNLISSQNFMGFNIPVLTNNYATSPLSHTYCTTWMVFIIIIKTYFEELGPNKAKAITDHYIGSSKVFKFLHPVLSWLLRRYLQNVTLSDTPVRERRGELRDWGYSFEGDQEGHSFEKSMNIFNSNIILPIQNTNGNLPEKLKILEILPNDGEYLFGRDDHLGIQIIRLGNNLNIYPRMCPHDGASLDRKCFIAGKDMKIKALRGKRARDIYPQGKRAFKITCPWHGRLFDPIASFKLDSSKTQTGSSDFTNLSLTDGVLTIKPLK